MNINGKKPLSQKQKLASPTADNFFGDPLKLDPKLLEVFEKHGVVHRFVSTRKLSEHGGYDPRGWVPVTTKKLKEMGYEIMDSFEHFGTDPDGYYRRSGNVLAIRKKEVAERHRAFLNQEASRASKAQKRHASDLREYARSNGMPMKIHEGYDDEESDK